jgi:hypothetical protein
MMMMYLYFFCCHVRTRGTENSQFVSITERVGWAALIRIRRVLGLVSARRLARLFVFFSVPLGRATAASFNILPNSTFVDHSLIRSIA